MAAKRSAQLLPKLHNLYIEVTRPFPQGMEIRRDQTVLGEASLGSGFPVDPGPHLVEVRAPGRKTFSKTIQIPTEPGESRVTIPQLEVEAAPVASAVGPKLAPSNEALPSPVQPKPGANQRTAAYVVGGVGVVGGLWGTYFGLRANSRWKASKGDCEGDVCSQAGLDKVSEARSAAKLSTIGFVVGAVGVGAAITLWATAPGDRAVTAGPSGITFRSSY